ncbi:Tat pathway signal sequence domain protein [Gleimia coleocanis DSM 15436]|uniref:Tat pathway signal sequence domain protein n=1 Tax=Gleimia coleocanis DSM 15436 TaxID=525245 RepID=C0W223_9ACTO|nr:CarD family transcriptional regulator [Gleimia coleocanis]EEH63237.1 Tat pathway signal sequence domain protein [Gleimia coleocanis DSM 15436]
MTFHIGETIVYPHHGAATIEEINVREFKGEKRTYLTLRVAQGDLTIQVPADNVEMVGGRDVVDEGGFQEVVDILHEDSTDEPAIWSRRYKQNQEKIASGSIRSVAEVVRDLTRRDAVKGLSAGEKCMLSKARQILTSEVALARGIDEAAAHICLDEILEEVAGAHQPQE